MCDLIVWSHGADGLDDSAVYRKMRLPFPLLPSLPLPSKRKSQSSIDTSVTTV